MRELYQVFLEEALSYGNEQIDLAICSLINAKCCRNLPFSAMRELIIIQSAMQAEQRRQWREGRP